MGSHFSTPFFFFTFFSFYFNIFPHQLSLSSFIRLFSYSVATFLSNLFQLAYYTDMTNEGKPTVLIVGAGLGGLMLGALLEKIGIPYVIFERTSSIKSLGKESLILSKTVQSHHHIDKPVALSIASVCVFINCSLSHPPQVLRSQSAPRCSLYSSSWVSM